MGTPEAAHSRNSITRAGVYSSRMVHARFRSNRLFCRIDASALAAVLTVLATSLLFLQSMTFTFHDGVSVQLPKVCNAVALPEAQRENVLLVFIFRDGQLFFDRQKATPQELTNKLQSDIGSGGPRSVYIKADEHVRYAAVLSVLDSVRSAGLTNVAFLTDNRN